MKQKKENRRPLMHDEFTQISTMADFYSFASQNIVPELYVKRLIKDIKAKNQNSLPLIGVTIAVHTEGLITKNKTKGALHGYGNGVNFEIFIRSKMDNNFWDLSFKKMSNNEVVEKIKKNWSMHTDNGRSIFIFNFESFDEADKAFGLSDLSDVKRLSLLKEIVEFERMLDESGFIIPDYITIKKLLDGEFCMDKINQKNICSLSPTP